MIVRAAMLALALAVGAGAVRAQTPVIRLDDAGPGVGPRALSTALSAPHDVVPPAANRYLFERDVARGRTVIVLGRDAILEGTIHGDVIVVGGDLYMHPGGRVDGRAITYGGGVYESALATVRGGVTAYRDFTYDITPTADGYALRYRALNPSVVPVFALGGLYGVSFPSYDRTNGLSLPLSVVVTPNERWSIVPRATYRSQLGALDPGVDAAYRASRLTTLRFVEEYSTYSNDTWIRSDLINGIHYFVLGNDTRNYYRGQRTLLSAERRIESATATLTPFAGLQVQSGRSVRPLAGATGGPWAINGRHDRDDVLRPNPPVDSTSIRSLLGGASLDWSSQGIVAHARLDLELATWQPPLSGDIQAGDRRFQQAVLDATIGFPTFGTQRLDVELHAVRTSGESPGERNAYLGGPGTLPTLDLLELGGNQLIFAEARYSVPLERVQVPFVGAPTLSFREILGGAGTRGFPELRQATGARLALGFLYGEVLVDPPHRRARFGAGISTGR